MKTQIVTIKALQKNTALFKDIYKAVFTEANKRHKPVSWFQFAKYSRNKYVFLANKNDRFDVLEQIAIDIAKRHKTYTTGEIVDVICDLVNNTVGNYLQQQNLTVKNKHTKRETKYINSLLIDQVNNSQLIPGYFWYMPVSKKKNNSWKAKDLQTNKIFSVVCSRKGKYLYYFVNS